ncbi:MAG: hypothetical protein AB1894_06270 [Chloroflexota bacterium]
MITTEKIEEWLKEVQERPESAALILQYIANRLRDLSSRNEALLEENIALQSGKRVEEYEQRIAHLEYQLELLKRQVGGQLAGDEILDTSQSKKLSETLSLLVYDALGKVLRFEIAPGSLEDGRLLGNLKGELSAADEAPRLFVTSSLEEILFVFTSGRVEALPVESLAPAEWQEQPKQGVSLDWANVPIPSEPRAGETLACLLPISKLALSEFFLQTSRKGCAKKIGTSMAQTILGNHYIGSGVKQSPDKMFDILLCTNEDHLILISRHGYMLRVEVKRLSFSVEDVIRLDATDHLAAVLLAGAGKSILVMTQVGKAIHLAEESLEVAQTLKTRGKALLSAKRRESGVRVVGAAAVSDGDWSISLDQQGHLQVQSMEKLLGIGTVEAQSELLAWTAFSASMRR